MRRASFVFLWVGFMICILIFSLIKLKNPLFIELLRYDKLTHILLYIFFFVMAYKSIPKLNLYGIALIAFTFGVFIEGMQHEFTHGLRRFDGSDILFNLLGISIAWLALRIWRFRLKVVQTCNAGLRL